MKLSYMILYSKCTLPVHVRSDNFEGLYVVVDRYDLE